jgi:hypothetical protein
VGWLSGRGGKARTSSEAMLVLPRYSRKGRESKKR